jgi:hypothetical protein
LLLVHLSEIGKSVIESDHVRPRHLRHGKSRVEFDLKIRTALSGAMTPGVIHENLAHQSGGHANEVRAVLRVERALVGEAQVSLVHEGCGLESVARALPFQIAVSDGAEFFVDEWDQCLKGLLIASPPFQKKFAKWLGR